MLRRALIALPPLHGPVRAAGIASVGLCGTMTGEDCLLSHGPSFRAASDCAAHHLVLVLRGAPPGDIPIDAPARSETAINLATAAPLGLVVAVPVLARADEVIA